MSNCSVPSKGSFSLTGSGASASVQLDHAVRGKVSTSLGMAGGSAEPDRIFLNLENVRGTNDATAFSVYINVPDGEIRPNIPSSRPATSACSASARRARWMARMPVTA